MRCFDYEDRQWKMHYWSLYGECHTIMDSFGKQNPEVPMLVFEISHLIADECDETIDDICP